MNKKLALLIALMFCLSIAVSGCNSDSETINYEDYQETTRLDYSKFEGTELRVYNWGYYISDGSEGCIDVNAEFEKLTGIKVVYDNFDSNESLYAKLSGGGVDYDVVIPSDYMIGRLIKEGYLAELNFDNIPNYKYIDERYKGTEYDPENKYSVPYNVGMVGVIYNTTMVEGTPTSWSLMWDEKYAGKILNFNNPRDAFAISQFYLGLNINSEDPKEWDKAYEKLEEQKPLLQSYVMDEVFNKMESGEAAIAPYYAGDFFTMYGNNEDLAFYYPEEGTNVFIDAACVLKNAKNKEAAELYINFLLDPKIARANAEYMYYASPNTAVVNDPEYQEFLSELHPDAFEILYGTTPEMANGNPVSFADLSAKTKEHMTKRWTDLRATNTDTSGDYIVYGICVVILVVLAVWLAYSTIRKKKRAQQYN